jgi:hypothetical protein
MGGLLDELGKRLAERWVQLLVLPGALYLAVAVAARNLGQGSPFDVPRLITQVVAWARAPAVTAVGGQVVLLSAVLAASATVGVAAQVLGSLAERFTLAAGWETWPSPFRQFADGQVGRRRRRWDAAHATYVHHYNLALQGEDPDPAARAAAYLKRSRIALERPGRPTWSGDRVNSVAVRLQRDLHVDLPTIWASLWLTLPAATRTEVTAARQALASATTMAAWALLYLVLAGWWWPAALIAAVLAVTGWHRTRTAADGYAALLEASTRVYARDLARQLGLDPSSSPDQRVGESLTAVLHTEPPPVPGGDR